MNIIKEDISFNKMKKDISQLLKLDDSLINLNKENILEQNYSKLKNNFTKLVPEYFINSVGKSIIEDIELGVHVEKYLHIMFIDMTGFTEISEKMEAEKALKLLNIYFDGIVEISKINGGYIDKFLGDGIMLVFNDKNSDNILKTAIEIQEFIKKINIVNIENKINIGIGINSGNATLGTIGSKKRMDVTIIGDTVNAASRIQNQTRLEKEWIIFSEETFSELENKNIFNIKEFGERKLRGKEKKIKLFGIYL